MPYLVRKINSMNKILELKELKILKDVKCDVIKNEFKTTGNCLSTYCIESLDNIQDAILAIALTADHFEKFDIIVLEEDQCSKFAINHKKTSPGCEVPINNLNSEHHDIIDLTYGKIEDVLASYRETANKEDYNNWIKRCNRGMLNTLVLDAFKTERLNIDIIKSENVKEKVQELLQNAM